MSLVRVGGRPGCPDYNTFKSIPAPSLVNSDLTLSNLPPEICDNIYGHLLPSKVLVSEPQHSNGYRSNVLAEFSTDIVQNVTILKTLYGRNRHILKEVLSRTTFGCDMSIAEAPRSWKLPRQIVDLLQHVSIVIDTDFRRQDERLQPNAKYFIYDHLVISETLMHFMPPRNVGIFGHWGFPPQISRGTLTVRFVHRDSMEGIHLSRELLRAISMMVCFEIVRVIFDASVRDVKLLALGCTHRAAYEGIGNALNQMVYGIGLAENPIQDNVFWSPQPGYGVLAYLEPSLGPATVSAINEISRPSRGSPSKTSSRNLSFPRSGNDNALDSEDEDMPKVGVACHSIKNEDLTGKRIRAERLLVFHPRDHIRAVAKDKARILS